MRRIAIWIVVGLSFTALMSAGAEAAWVRDTARTFYIDVPQGWTTRTFADAVHADVRIFGLASDDGHAAVRIRTMPVGRGTAPDSLRTTFEKSLPGITAATPPQQTTIGRKRGIEASYDWNWMDATYRVSARFVVAQKFGRHTGIIVWRTVIQNAAPALEQTAKAASDSFSLLRPRDLSAASIRPPVEHSVTPLILGDLKRARQPAQSVPQTPPSQQPTASATALAPPPSCPPVQVCEPTTCPPPPACAPLTCPPVVEPPVCLASPQKSAVEARPDGASKCLDATTPDGCGCDIGLLRPAFTELEKEYVALAEAVEAIQTDVEQTMAAQTQTCGKDAYRKAVQLSEDVKSMATGWVLDRLVLLGLCTDQHITKLGGTRERPGMNETLDKIIDETRMVKYDALLLRAEFERFASSRDHVSGRLSDVTAACEAVQGSKRARAKALKPDEPTNPVR